jgi:citrate synthase
VHVLSLLQVKNLIGGMRGLKALLWEGSVLDPNEARAYPMMLSVKFLTYIIRVSASTDCPSQIAKKNSPLPSMARRSSLRACSGSCSPDRSRPQNKSVPSPMSSRSVESFPSLSRNSLTRVFLRRQSIRSCQGMINFCSFPKTLHPMTQLSMGVAALNHDSAFAAAYEKGIKKTDYWTYTYEDSINLLAKLPALAARIYRNIYRAGEELPGVKKDLDLVGEYLCKSAILPSLNFAIRKLLQHAWLWKQQGHDRVPPSLHRLAR